MTSDIYKKKKLGQFYTTNSNYIFTDLFVEGYPIIEPFTGAGDLVRWFNKEAELYDIDPKYKGTIKKDSLLNPPVYKGKYVVTNPPYLNKNKAEDKSIFLKYGVDDLYKAFLCTIIDGEVEGGIIIIPINFLCSRDFKIRNKFFSNYTATHINIFEEQVFDDTSTQVCAIKFIRGRQTIPIKTTFFPSRKVSYIKLKEEHYWLFGGEILERKKSNFIFGRLLKEKPLKAKYLHKTNWKLYASDTGGASKIRLEFNKEHYYGKNTDRMFATITSNISVLDEYDEHHVVDEFNRRLAAYREEYNSMFLTSYRNSTTYPRKRISFTLAFTLINNIIVELINKDDKTGNERCYND